MIYLKVEGDILLTCSNYTHPCSCGVIRHWLSDRLSVCPPSGCFLSVALFKIAPKSLYGAKLIRHIITCCEIISEKAFLYALRYFTGFMQN